MKQNITDAALLHRVNIKAPGMAVEWTIIDEIRLFRWAAEFKPAGIHKHFHMLCVLERMNHPEKYPLTLLQKESTRVGKLFTAREIWDKLSQYYNLSEMDKLEDQIVQPVPKSDVGQEETEKTMLEHKLQLTQRKDFGLPWDEYGELILENAKNGALDEELGHNELNLKKKDNKPVKNELKEHHEIVDRDLNSHEEKSITPPEVENWDGKTPQSQTIGKRRSTRLRKSTRLNRANNEENSGEENDGESEEVDGDSEKELSEDSNVHPEAKHKKSAKNGTDEPDEPIKEKSADQFDKGKEEKEEDAGIEENLPEEKLNMKRSEEMAPKVEGQVMDKSINGTNEDDEGKETQEEKEQEQEQEGEKDDTGEEDIGEDEDDTVDTHNGKPDNQPPAERTRQSSSVGSTTAETSPKRKKRNTEQQASSSKPPRTSMRVSSRLRNRKQ